MAENIRRRAVQFVLKRQAPQGGFRGRGLDPDIYYSAFALRVLNLLGELNTQYLQPTCCWVAHLSLPTQSLVNLYSYCQCLETLAESNDSKIVPIWRRVQDTLPGLLNNYRTGQGGFAARPGDSQAATYQTFLALLCYDLVNQSPSNPEQIVSWLMSQRRPDGGFADHELAPFSGTNPTAAALASLLMIDAISSELREEIIRFLLHAYVPHLGFRAHARIPVPDLLSTFTALWSLWQLGAISLVNIEQLYYGIAAHQHTCGGFFAHLADSLALQAASDESLEDDLDVEYTFYGLASLSLLALHGRTENPNSLMVAHRNQKGT
ncbi:MAG: terpene cyclase/mutase family protein [Gemmatales bacterium]|nr:terpene cyclase/mutase family protein [Gemmatales bacterium]MDW8174667.1 terpene cyclase/mutase family protein [Gemmatales bacterium]